MIDDLKQQIDAASQKPLHRVAVKNDDMIKLDNINLVLSASERSADDCESRSKGLSAREKKPNKQQVGDLWNAIDHMDDQITLLKEGTRLCLQRQKIGLIRKLDTHFTAYQKELLNDKLKQTQKAENPADKEHKLRTELEVMTAMAQELDDEHQKLKDAVKDLQIKESSQSSDSDLLIKQILYYKRQHKTLAEVHSKLKLEVEKTRREDD